MRNDLASLVVECMFEIDAFNDRIGIRNDFILKDPKNVKVFNEGAFDSYREVVVPKLSKFIDFIEENKESLIDKPFIPFLIEKVF